MKTFNVDVEKQIIKVALEMDLQTDLIGGLAALADGRQLVVTIEQNQRELPLDEPPADHAQGDLFADADVRDLINRHAAVMADLRLLDEDDQDGDLKDEGEALCREIYERGLTLVGEQQSGVWRWVETATGEIVESEPITAEAE